MLYQNISEHFDMAGLNMIAYRPGSGILRFLTKMAVESVEDGREVLFSSFSITPTDFNQKILEATGHKNKADPIVYGDSVRFLELSSLDEINREVSNQRVFVDDPLGFANNQTYSRRMTSDLNSWLTEFDASNNLPLFYTIPFEREANDVEDMKDTGSLFVDTIPPADKRFAFKGFNEEGQPEIIQMES
jgi:hypothetical protein